MGCRWRAAATWTPSGWSAPSSIRSRCACGCRVGTLRGCPPHRSRCRSRRAGPSGRALRAGDQGGQPAADDGAQPAVPIRWRPRSAPPARGVRSARSRARRFRSGLVTSPARSDPLHRVEHPDGTWWWHVEYQTALFDAGRGFGAWSRHAQLVLGSALDHPDRQVSQVPMLTPAERGFCAAVRGPDAPIPDPPVHELIWQRAALAPARTAIVHSTGNVSYAELMGRAREIARELRASGVRDGDRVIVRLARGPELVAALLGVGRLAPPVSRLTHRIPSRVCGSSWRTPRRARLSSPGPGRDSRRSHRCETTWHRRIRPRCTSVIRRGPRGRRKASWSAIAPSSTS